MWFGNGAPRTGGCQYSSDKKGRGHTNTMRISDRKMTDAVVSALQEEEIPVLVKTLDSLSAFFKSYREED